MNKRVEIFGCLVTPDEAQTVQALHDMATLENVIDELHHDYMDRASREVIANDRERIQAAADKLAALLSKLGTAPVMQAAE